LNKFTFTSNFNNKSSKFGLKNFSRNYVLVNLRIYNQKMPLKKENISNLKINTLQNALYIVPTPIGNLRDITLRALDVLSEVKTIICEDSRVSGKLLNFYQISGKKFIIYNDNSQEEVRKKILHLLLSGKSIALLSDAGTPLISDPGYKLISFLKNFNQKIIPLPGACAVTTAICASAIACDNFLFIGFLPTSKIQKENLLESLKNQATFVFFEAPTRVLKTLQSIKKVLGNRKICIAKELTKLHEEIISDEVDNLIKSFEVNDKIKGEFVIIVQKSDKDLLSFSKEDLSKAIKSELKNQESLKDLSQKLSEIYGINKKEIYQLAIKLSK
jgi:16S rRNA (cytidine1402-2'-O)-methyltransferase